MKFLVCFLSQMLLFPLLLPGQPLRVGRAAVEITPPVGVPLSSGYVYESARGVHDSLFAKALVLEQTGTRAALVVCDIIGVPGPVVEEARRLIGRSAGLDSEFVMISATHSHSTAAVDKVSLSWTDPQAQQAASEYLTGLPGKIAEAVGKAVADLHPARVSAALGREESLSFNRRWVMKDGSVRWNPVKLDPDLVRPAGPIDPDVLVLYFETLEGEPLATVVNFAEHVAVVATQADRRFSADHPHYLAAALARVKGPEMLTVFVNGASGNLNHINRRESTQLRGLPEAARIGTILAADVLRLYSQLKPVPAGAVRGVSETVDFPQARPSPDAVQQARAVWKRAADGQRPQPTTLEIAAAHRTLWEAERAGAPLAAEVQVIALGRDVAWVGLPGEIFAELGLAIKLASPFPYTIIAGVTNDYLSYVPDQKAYDEGQYEVEVTSFPRGSGEKLVETAVRLLLELHRDGGSDPTRRGRQE